jgi:hypothetical protein
MRGVVSDRSTLLSKNASIQIGDSLNVQELANVMYGIHLTETEDDLIRLNLSSQRGLPLL